MWKRLINKESDKPLGGPGTSTGARSGEGKLAHSQDKGDIEGFVCPICMQSYTKPEDLQTHFDSHNQDFEKSGHEKSVQGHICPTCKASFPTSDALQLHQQQQQHTSNGLGDLLDGLLSKTYSKENAEFEMLKQQLKASEESRLLLSQEVHLVQKQLTQTENANAGLRNDKEVIEQKAGKLAAELVAAKARADEAEGQKAALDDHIRTLKLQMQEKSSFIQALELQLSQRPTGDDVVVLRQELANAQKMMDIISQEREKEKEHLELKLKNMQEKFLVTEEKANQLELQIRIAPREHELQRLQSELTQTSSTSGKMEQMISEQEAIVKERDERIATISRTLREKDKDMEDLKEKLLEMEEVVASKDKLITHKESLILSASRIETEKDGLIQEKIDKIDGLSIKLKELRKELESKELLIEEAEKSGKNLQKLLSEKTASLDEIRKELSEVHQKLGEREEELSLAKEELTAVEQRSKAMESQTVEKQATVEKFLESSRAQEEEKTRLQSKKKKVPTATLR